LEDADLTLLDEYCFANIRESSFFLCGVGKGGTTCGTADNYFRLDAGSDACGVVIYPGDRASRRVDDRYAAVASPTGHAIEFFPDAGRSKAWQSG
jgi:hypothetical protein